MLTVDNPFPSTHHRRRHTRALRTVSHGRSPTPAHPNQPAVGPQTRTYYASNSHSSIICMRCIIRLGRFCRRSSFSHMPASPSPRNTRHSHPDAPPHSICSNRLTPHPPRHPHRRSGRGDGDDGACPRTRRTGISRRTVPRSSEGPEKLHRCSGAVTGGRDPGHPCGLSGCGLGHRRNQHFRSDESGPGRLRPGRPNPRDEPRCGPAGPRGSRRGHGQNP